jgi:hypothetical protein
MCLVPTEEPEKLRERKYNGKFSWKYIAAEVVLGIAIIALFYVQSLREIVASTEATTKSERQHITQLNSTLSQKNAIITFLRSSRLKVIPMQGKSKAAGSHGSIVWDQDKKNVLVHFSNLPPSENGKEYHLWAIEQQKPVIVDTFSIHDAKDANDYLRTCSFDIKDTGNVDSFLLTLESISGKGQPSDNVCMKGDIGSQQ